MAYKILYSITILLLIYLFIRNVLHTVAAIARCGLYDNARRVTFNVFSGLVLAAHMRHALAAILF